MKLQDAENTLRVAAQSWAALNSLQFLWDNAPAVDAGLQPTLSWGFRTESVERLTIDMVQHAGAVLASVFVPAGQGVNEGFALAESLVALFRGSVHSGIEMLDEASVVSQRRVGANYRIDIRLPWTFTERRVAQGAVSPFETPGFASCYEATRERWETEVRAPLDVRCYFDNDPPEEVNPPFLWVRFRLLEPVSIELGAMRVPGRILCALHYPLGSGVNDAEIAIQTMVSAFDECVHRGVVFGTPRVTRIGKTPSSTWQAVVRLPFYYEVRI